MTVTVAVPWRGGCRFRERALRWVLDKYAAAHPDWRVVVARAPEGRWVKANAVRPAVEAATTDLVVVADGDVWCDELEIAVEAVEIGAPWAIPHRDVFRLTRAATSLLIGGADPRGLELEERPYQRVQGGGLLVAPRETLLDIPPDPRFVGWGCEDAAWAMALHFLAGPSWKNHAPLWHLWHPPQPRPARDLGSPESEALLRRYRKARATPAAMRALIDEVHDAAPHTAEQAVHAHPAHPVG